MWTLPCRRFIVFYYFTRCCTDICFTTEEMESLLVWLIHRSFPHTHAWFVCAWYVNVLHLVEPNSKPSASLLSSALDWELWTFLSKQLKFPDHVTPTFLRPAVLHTQVSSKQVLLFNLTVSQEYCMEKANECIWLRYWELTNQCRRSSWRMYCEPIEVGCWCLAACSLCKTQTFFGIRGAAKVKAIKSAQRAPRWIWIKRSNGGSMLLGNKSGPD